jgi:hypothetical protein
MVQAASYGGQSYQAAYQTVVPVDVYQDLVAELQETQALARNLEIQNRELWQQNQQLQQEMSKFLGAVQQLQGQVITTTPIYTHPAVTIDSPVQRLKTVITQSSNVKHGAIDDDQEADIESNDLSIWNILITVICIIAVGVSVGYTAFRPAK